MGVMDALRSLFALEERATMPPPHVPVDNFLPWVQMNGNRYPLVTTLGGDTASVVAGFEGFATTAYAGNGIVFSCLNARMSLFKQARFMYRALRSGTPGELHSAPALDLLRTPWPNGTTADLLSRMIQDADLGGDSMILRRDRSTLARLRPDWAATLHGSYNDPNVGMWDPEAELLGYAYWPGGYGIGTPRIYDVAQVAHFAPIPDPLSPARGMSWLTPLIREIESDSAATSHKLAYFRNGATPNLVVTNVPGATQTQYDDWVARFAGKHDGTRNAYKTMYLSGSATAAVIGNDLAAVDFKAVQGAGETRIAAAAGVPPIVVGLSEGLAGSSLNAGNFQAAMRRFADLTGRALWEDAAGALATIVPVPGGSELWYDDRYIPALKDDIKDAAEVQSLNAQAIRTYIDAGFEPDAVVDAVNAGDLKRLTGKHTGLYSVQLQAPGTTTPEPVAEPVPAPAPEPAPRDAGLSNLLELAERRAVAAERRADTPAPAPVVHITTPEVTSTVTIERGDGATDRITATVDAGNRTAVTLDGGA